MESHRIVSREQWLEERTALLAKEKAFTRMRDELNAQRRALPWVKIEKEYVFDAPEGEVTLAQLFDERGQLFIKHFMMGPGQTTQCVGCSLEVDHVEGLLEHMENHDLSYVAVARAPIEEIETVRKRMGWRFRWGLLVPQRLQLRFQRLVQAGGDGGFACVLQLGIRQSRHRGSFRRQRLLQRCRRADFSHLFGLRARRRRFPRHLPLLRRHAQGTRGERSLSFIDRLGAPAKHVSQRRHRRGQRPLS